MKGRRKKKKKGPHLVLLLTHTRVALVLALVQILVEQQLASIALRQGLTEGVLSDPDKAGTVLTRVAEVPLPTELRGYFNSPPGMAEVRLIQEKSGSNITLEPGSADPHAFVARLTGTEYQVKMGSELLQQLLVRFCAGQSACASVGAGERQPRALHGPFHRSVPASPRCPSCLSSQEPEEEQAPSPASTPEPPADAKQKSSRVVYVGGLWSAGAGALRSLACPHPFHACS